MELSLFDLHCDTAYEMHRTQQPLTRNSLAISLENARKFKRYVQVMAIWTDHRLNDEEGWKAYLDILNHLKNDAALPENRAVLQSSFTDCEKPTLLLSVEDARILGGKLERVDRLWADGVRFLIPFWKGVNCLGGAHDTAQGLTDFGKAALTRALELGMVLDISHASENSAQSMFELAEARSRPVIASHSNAYDICPVSRNLRKEQIASILKSGGVIGINLYPPFLCKNPVATTEAVIPHIEYFLEQGAADALCIGGDMDGATLPRDIPNLAALPVLAELMLQHNYSEELIRKLFFDNAFGFAKRHLR